MKNQVLFIQGGGDDGYTADKPLVTSLMEALGEGFEVHYPPMPADESIMEIASNWLGSIEREISMIHPGLTIVAHSLGASLVLKYLSEHRNIPSAIKGVFLLATPFWSSEKDWIDPLKLRAGFAEHLPGDLPVYMYHCSDDEEVPLAHFNRYRSLLRQAQFREISQGGHQFNNDLKVVAQDIILL